MITLTTLVASNAIFGTHYFKRFVALASVCTFILVGAETIRADGQYVKAEPPRPRWGGNAVRAQKSCIPKVADIEAVKEVKNIIFMIGDGMGIATTYAAMSSVDHPLNFERFPVTGLQKTFSADNFITDSAAAGTALANGKKTQNGVIGLDAKKNRTKSILKLAQEHNLATGLIAVTSITDATPAAFVAHVSNRTNQEAIAMDIMYSGVDVFVGGGYNYFAKRSDKLNLLDGLVARGYEVHTNMAKVGKSHATKLAALVAPTQCAYRLKGRGDMLPVASAKAIEILNKNTNGFFLMIEGSHIDHGGHDNDAKVLVDEVLDFDEALGVALDFAKADGHTLVVVTADHETGGVTIIGGDMKKHTVKLNFSTKGHTAVMVPVYAFGPGADKFTGIYDNTALIGKLSNSYGFSQ